MRQASPAAIISPVSSISMACLAATLRDSATIGVEQNRPILTPGVQNVAASDGNREVAGRDELAAGGGRDALRRRRSPAAAGAMILCIIAAQRVHDVGEIGAAAGRHRRGARSSP
ncbi:MAG: hypothetical protein QM722_01255 [Piscinibacter sp.]